MRECEVPGCGRKHESSGLCHSHYAQWRRTGKRPTAPIAAPLTMEARFFAKVKRLPSGHWIWTAARSGNRRYGTVQYDGRVQPAHRVAWQMLRGPIPDGLVVDHVCRVSLCVNPEHLQCTTQRQNVIRGDAPSARNAAKTHCKRGHEFTPENTRVLRSGGRLCLACQALPEMKERNRNRMRVRRGGLSDVLRPPHQSA